MKDIKGIIIGGISSRFWMLRKHMNIINNSMYTNYKIPFFAWECLTIQLTNRDIDLVIKNEKDMDDLLMVLVHAINTADGNQGSANAVTRYVFNNQKIKREEFD